MWRRRSDGEAEKSDSFVSKIGGIQINGIHKELVWPATKGRRKATTVLFSVRACPWCLPACPGKVGAAGTPMTQTRRAHSRLWPCLGFNYVNRTAGLWGIRFPQGRLLCGSATPQHTVSWVTWHKNGGITLFAHCLGLSLLCKAKLWSTIIFFPKKKDDYINSLVV